MDKISDKTLLKYYMKGFNDCGDSKDISKTLSGLRQRAYDIGWIDFIVGDDVPSHDYRSNADRIKQIRNDPSQKNVPNNSDSNKDG